MANQILADTKELLGIPASTTVFDGQLVGHINAAFFSLNDLGVGTGVTYLTTLTDGNLDEFLPGEDPIHPTLQMYIFMKVRLLFDPPTTSFVLESLVRQISELEFRIKDYSAA